MYTEDRDESQSSAWSIPLAWARVYSVLFFIIGGCGVGWVAWREVAEGGFTTQAAYNVIVGSGPVGIGTATICVIIVFGGDFVMVMSTWVRQKQFERGQAEGRAEGQAEGRAEGQAERQARWEEWNRRRMDAEAQGRPFTEPPPGQEDVG